MLSCLQSSSCLRAAAQTPQGAPSLPSLSFQHQTPPKAGWEQLTSEQSPTETQTCCSSSSFQTHSFIINSQFLLLTPCVIIQPHILLLPLFNRPFLPRKVPEALSCSPRPGVSSWNSQTPEPEPKPTLPEAAGAELCPTAPETPQTPTILVLCWHRAQPQLLSPSLTDLCHCCT